MTISSTSLAMLKVIRCAAAPERPRPRHTPRPRLSRTGEAVSDFVLAQFATEGAHAPVQGAARSPRLHLSVTPRSATR